MSGRDGVHLLVDIVAKGGNLLLNVAPGPDGTWQQGAYDLLAQIGAWLKVNGEAIYGSRAIAPYAEGRVRMTRQKNGTIYFIYLADTNETAMPAEIRVTSHRPAAGAAVTLLGSPATARLAARRRRLRRDDPGVGPIRPAVPARVGDQGDRDQALTAAARDTV